MKSTGKSLPLSPSTVTTPQLLVEGDNTNVGMTYACTACWDTQHPLILSTVGLDAGRRVITVVLNRLLEQLVVVSFIWMRIWRK